MKPNRYFLNNTPLFGSPLRCGAPVVAGLVVFVSGLSAEAGDVLRGGRATASGSPGAPATAGAPTPAATDAARANARDILRRTNQSLDAMRAMQAAARSAAISGPNQLGSNLPAVPNGLIAGGLKPAVPTAATPTPWTGADNPVQTVAGEQTTVTIKQTAQQALLHWDTLNVGKNTTLAFDQTAGGENAAQWIAFNKITDPTGNPTQILGSIMADGQIYIINQNGIIFGGSSQVNARSLTVSSLPVNTELIKQGLLNNRDAQFLFSGLRVPGGADGTKDFIPEAPPASGRYGDVTVQAGAVLSSPADSSGNGGRILLVGPNVTNAGTLSSASGQTILAAGLQAAVAAHDGKDPSLRGLDVWVGVVDDNSGTATNTGLIETLTGNTTMAGRTVNQLGVLDSSTSVSLNGRLDLKAGYGAVANPNFDSTTEPGAGGPMFFNQFTGTVTLGSDSLTRILPDYASDKAVPGTALPERSQVNIEGLAIHFDKASTLLAPGADVMVRAGTWPYRDVNGDRTIFGADGQVEAGITSYFTGPVQKFLFDAGQIYVDEAAMISVAGSAGVLVPLSQSILTVELRGAELADSPLQRESNLRGVALTVDIRNTGTYNGKFWIGTPLGDVTGLAGLIQRTAAQLTTAGGNLTLQAGGSIVVRNGSSLDVSGGSSVHEAGLVSTSWLLSNGRLVAIKDATPDQVYDGVYSGENTGPLLSGAYQESYIEGAAGGSLSLTAPGMALDGQLRGLTAQGPRQRSAPPADSRLNLVFDAEKAMAVPGSTTLTYLSHSPTPPGIRFASTAGGGTVPEFSLGNPLPADRLATVTLASGLLGEAGFGALAVRNPDGNITVPAEVILAALPKGSLTLAAANLAISGAVNAPGGKLDFTTYNISPSVAAEYAILNPAGSAPFPLPAANRGLLMLASTASLSTAGKIVDDRANNAGPADEAAVTAGGDITLRSFNASLATGAVIDVSGGVQISNKSAYAYGKGGNLTILTGADPGFAGLVGGSLTLGSTLRGYSGGGGGSLTLQASRIAVGGGVDPGALVLGGDFFRSGGFTQYALTGIGAASTAAPPPGLFESYLPAIQIAPGTNLRPLAENFIARTDDNAVTLVPFVNADGLRTPVSLAFNALGSDDPYTIDRLEIRGDILMDNNTSIVTDPGASVSFKGGTVALLGSVIAPGGKVAVTGAGAFPLTASQRLSVTQALPTVHLGPAARLVTAGTVLLKPAAYGRRVGTVLQGGTISISGNILAERGVLLDVAGSSGVLDLSPASLAGGAIAGGGLTSPPLALQTIATRVDSNGGTIDLIGSQMLLSDATLRGGPGGPTATGGSLSISSGRYYRDGESRTGADINLTVTQSGNGISYANNSPGIGLAVTDSAGAAAGNQGWFALDRFSQGSFSSLSLGGKYYPSGNPIPYGGNVEFRGAINLLASGTVRLAAGGVIRADSAVNITAAYLSLGQDFRPPENPEDSFIPFQRDPALPSSAYPFAPTFGPGSLAFNAPLIDVGTLALLNIGRTDFTAGAGDIRGNGTLSLAGALTLDAAKVYPTSAGSFAIFAYDHSAGKGSVTIRSIGNSEIPLSAGGSLAVYASSIRQGGVLIAPLGTIRLGWDGTDLDPSTAALDAPINLVAGTTAAAPIATEVTLGATSVTSVSAADGAWLAPFGISPDGQSWIDPRGVNVTLSGLPEKSVFIAGESVTMAAGAVVDIRGGGDLLASRWVPGNGGSINLLGSAAAAWGAGTKYGAGDLVTFNGTTWSARVGHSGQQPAVSLYWSKVAESFAILPSAGLAFAPYGPFNTESNATALAGDPGYVSTNLKVGDTITLDAGPGLTAGTYTLLPRRYALLPGAYLVTPLTGSGSGVVTTPDGATQVSGFLGNRFEAPAAAPVTRTRFELAGAAVVSARAAYDLYSANGFLGAIADQLQLANPQRLPQDAGYAAFHGNSGLQLAGLLRTPSPGLGAVVDISSFAALRLMGGGASAAGSGNATLQTAVLNSWDADSLLVGGLRHHDAKGQLSLEVRTASLTLDNPAEELSATDIGLVSKAALTITASSGLTAVGTATAPAEPWSVVGDGTLLRMSVDPAAAVLRAGFGGSTAPLLTIGSGANLNGAAVTLDSTYGTNLAADVMLHAERLALGSGQLSVLCGNASGTLGGSVVTPHLTLAGATLDRVFQSKNLTLQSYRSIDFYGSGALGGPALEQLTLIGSGLRGYEQGTGTVTLRAGEVTLENPANAVALAAPANNTGIFQLDATTIRLGSNSFTVAGYQNVALNAADSLRVAASGTLALTGGLLATTPLITSDGSVAYTVNAAGAMMLNRGTGVVQAPTALGASLTLQAAAITANTAVLLPSGQLTLRATTGNLEVGGNLAVAGSSQAFNDLIRFTDAGSLTLDSLAGDVVLGSGSTVSVAAAAAAGHAGLLNVSAAGSFLSAGTLSGQAALSTASGRFTLAVNALTASGPGTLATIDTALDAGGFTASRSFAIRSGEVTIDHRIVSHEFSLTADQGGIRVTGEIDASGVTGGRIALAAHGDLILASGARLSVAADTFDSAGKGGAILLEAGTQRGGAANPSALLDLQAGATLDLTVREFVAGRYDQPGSSAFAGKFTGTLHLRAPRTTANDDLRIAALQSTITGASSIVAEGFQVYAPAGGILNIAFRNQIHANNTSFLGAAGSTSANETAMRTRLLGGASAALNPILVLAPGVEIINPTGDLTLGLANPAGSTTVEALAAADWDLSAFRYGSRGAAGVLTLRAAGDLVFNNTLSDGFIPIAQGTAQNFADNGNSLMWLATLAPISDLLPTNTQSWSYRLTAGANTNSADFRRVLSSRELDVAQPLKGSVIIGEFYPAVPNRTTTGTGAAVGSIGQTADTIRISTTTTNRGTRFEVVRTGTGDITVSAGRDIQLRNQFATLYTAGVALPNPTTVFHANDFVLPGLPMSAEEHPTQSGGPGITLGAVQQLVSATWSMAGGNIQLAAGRDMGRFTMVNGQVVIDSTRQMPTNWLYRRGYVDATTNQFAADGGFGADPTVQDADNLTDVATSTTWWIDYSNFFQGIGTLGGGNLSLTAGRDLVNLDAVAPTNARSEGRLKNPDFGTVANAPEYLNLNAATAKLLELGGGDVTVTAGRDLSGGVYYVERGGGSLMAGGRITTNSSRSVSLGILTGAAPLDPLTWLPTTLFAGKAQFKVTALGDVLLGPVTNPFLLPQGLNNKFWYKTYFSTFAPDARVDIASYGGDLTLRNEITLPGSTTPSSALGAWFNQQNLFTGAASAFKASQYQPWIRLTELGLGSFESVFPLTAPTLTGTAFGGNLNVVGDLTLFPSPSGNLELAAAGNLSGLQMTGPSTLNGRPAQIWTAATINVSDSSPALLPAAASPLAYQAAVGRSKVGQLVSGSNILQNVSLALSETGSYAGTAGTAARKDALHADGLHRGNSAPVRLFATGGDITGLKLFTPKVSQVLAGRDISDVSFYLQNLDPGDVSIVAAGRDILPFNEGSATRVLASNLAVGNFVGDSLVATSAGTTTNALAGDLQINGPGVLEVLAGGTIDLGNGANLFDGTGVGITSIGNNRNPHLPFAGADLVAMAGVTGPGGVGPARGLSYSSLNIATFINTYLTEPAAFNFGYWNKLGDTLNFSELSAAQQALVALEKFYFLLGQAGRGAAVTGTYDPGYAAVSTLFGPATPAGDIITQAREIRTTSGGAISLGVPGGRIAMASDIFGNPLTPPGIVTEYGGAVATFTHGNVDIGQARIFTLRGGDIVMWSSTGNIAAGSSPRTVVTAPPTRVVIDITSADVQTDLGGLATGGGIGVLAAVEGVAPGNVDLIAPQGFVDAGDAGIRVTGNLNIAANLVLNASNISAGGTTTGASVATAAPSVTAVTSASNAASGSTSTAVKPTDAQQATETTKPPEEMPSLYTVEVIGYGGGASDAQAEDDTEKTKNEEDPDNPSVAEPQ